MSTSKIFELFDLENKEGFNFPGNDYSINLSKTNDGKSFDLEIDFRGSGYEALLVLVGNYKFLLDVNRCSLQKRISIVSGQLKKIEVKLIDASKWFENALEISPKYVDKDHRELKFCNKEQSENSSGILVKGDKINNNSETEQFLWTIFPKRGSGKINFILQKIFSVNITPDKGGCANFYYIQESSDSLDSTNEESKVEIISDKTLIGLRLVNA